MSTNTTAMITFPTAGFLPAIVARLLGLLLLPV